MKTPELQTSAEKQAETPYESVLDTDTENQLARIEALLAKLTQAVIAAHARIDSHADEIVRACEIASADSFTKLSERTLHHINEGAERVSESILQAKTATCVHLAEAGSLFAQRLETIDNAVQARLGNVADRVEQCETSASAAKRSWDVRDRLSVVEQTVVQRLNAVDKRLANLDAAVVRDAEATRNHVDVRLKDALARANIWFWLFLVLLILLILLRF